MCLLIATTGKARPSKKALRRAAVQNPDGFGFAVIGDGKIYTYRSMDSSETIKHYFEVRDEYPEGDSIFHLRITTHGSTNIENCHPFQVTDGVVMGHNGMLPIKEEGGRSDTRIFAEEWLPQFELDELLDTESGIADLSKFASGSKLAFLNTTDVLRKSLYIVNENLGHWDNGVWYSNNSYKKSYGSYTRYYGSYNEYPGIYTIGKPQTASKPSEDRLYQITDKRSSSVYDMEPSSGYRPWSPNDLVWDEEECVWVSDDGDYDGDTVCWICSACNGAQIYDLADDYIDFCPECGQCWYCERPWSECFCADVMEDF